MNLTVSHKNSQDSLIVYLSGELDQHTADIVRSAIEKEWTKKLAKHIVLNLENLTFMDSSGLGVILGRYKQVNNDGGKLVICCINRQVDKIVELSGLKKIMSFYETETDALKALGEE
ncbi:anti-sigma F factor antagonist [Desulfuribacillus stibiiarsenatis]|uniref:Anti-sigma F factor antagonist n=1 Tax=Desulfuribacillus stibiiarsenatis TaxID=1390249 RepID=A0A1E5L6F2_9FIRM|nr:anti-sigma F factor antagonist [Desulfuribacillus stibiiarsenatis]OEH85701.1 anti-sigma F factor antagonist [Desulfuribacillus stibiiarsenatis]